MLQVFYIYIYALLDPVSTLSFVKPLVSMILVQLDMCDFIMILGMD